MPNLKKIVLDTNNEDHYVFIDVDSIKAVQVQLPINTSGLITVQGELSSGIVRVFLLHMTAPFQFTRETVEEVESLVHELTDLSLN